VKSSFFPLTFALMKIIYLRHKEIDKEKWNTTVDRAANGQIYAYAWYLDCVADNWAALVSEDYAYIMPLPWNAKWLGVKQIYQPVFTQQLGIFGKISPSAELVSAFIKAIPKQFKYILTQLNEENVVKELVDFQVKSRCNMLLDLSTDYENLQQNFRKSLRRRIRQGQKELHFKTNVVKPEKLADNYRQYLNHKVGLSDAAYQTILSLMQTALALKKGSIYSAHFSDNTLAGGIFFTESHNRMVQLFGFTTPSGKKINATHFLIDAIIQKYAKSNRIFDFEGSDIKPIAEFFRGFRPQEVIYHQIIKDEFPFWIKGLQRLKQRAKL